MRKRARVEPESHDRADRHSHIFVESGPNWTSHVFPDYSQLLADRTVNGCEHFHLMQLVSVRVREVRVTAVCGGFADQDRCSKRAVVRSRLKESTFVVGSGDRQQQQRRDDDEDSTSNAILI